MRQKIVEFENDVRLDEGVGAIPSFQQRARDRAFAEIARHTRNNAPTRTAEFFQEVFEELALLTRTAIREEEGKDTFRVEVQVGEGARPHVAKSKLYSVEAAREWINSEPGNSLIRAIIENYEK